MGTHENQLGRVDVLLELGWIFLVSQWVLQSHQHCIQANQQEHEVVKLFSADQPNRCPPDGVVQRHTPQG